MNDISESISDFVTMHGLLLKSPDLKTFQNAPISLYPTKFPKNLFDYAVRIQKDFQLLFNKISRDHDVLKDVLKRVIKTDNYVKNLWSIYETIVEDGLIQPVFLGLIRNDYMVHIPAEFNQVQDDCSISQLFDRPGVSLKQVEYNLIASSFGGLSQKLVDLHRMTMKISNNSFEEDQIPPNKSADGLAKGLLCAWKVYCGGSKLDAAILFIVSAKERNVFDQRYLEESIYEQNPRVRVIFRTFEYCADHGKLDDNKVLTIDGTEIAVIYFRHGYTEDHFYNEKIWSSKLLLERSRAIKSPSIQHMLVNTKLVQQSLTRHDLLKRYVSDSVAVDIQETFVGQYLLKDGDDDDDEVMNMVLKRPHDFVLKPQREGGGNNYFGVEILEKLNSIRPEEKDNYIFMDRINPPLIQNQVLKSNGDIVKMDVVSELGIFGVFLGSETDIYANFQCGHLLRGKSASSNETGIAAGFGFIDSPLLIG